MKLLSLNLSQIFEEYPKNQVLTCLVLAVVILVLLIVIIIVAVKLHKLSKKLALQDSSNNESVTPVVTYSENDEEDEIEEDDDTPKDQIEEIESSIINLDAEKVEDSKITTPRKMNLVLRLNGSTNALKERYSKLRNHLESYKLRHSFLKHRDVYYIDEEILSKDDEGNMINKTVAHKVAMMTIRKKQLLLSLNINLNSLKTLPNIVNENIVIDERRYEGYNLNLKISTKQDLKESIKLINSLLQQLKIKEKKSHKEIDYVEMFSQPLSTFELRGFGYLVRDNITFAEAEKYKDSLSVKAIIINKINEVAPKKNLEYAISLDELKNKFSSGAKISLDILKQMKVAPKEANKLVVTDGTSLDKKLFIDADGFSSNAIKMIFLTGGEARINKRSAK